MSCNLNALDRLCLTCPLPKCVGDRKPGCPRIAARRAGVSGRLPRGAPKRLRARRAAPASGISGIDWVPSGYWRVRVWKNKLRYYCGGYAELEAAKCVLAAARVVIAQQDSSAIIGALPDRAQKYLTALLLRSCRSPRS